VAKKKLKGEPKPKLAKVYIVQRDSYRDDVIEQMYIDGIMMAEKREKRVGEYIR